MKHTLPDKIEDSRIAGPEYTRSGACFVRVGSASLKVLFSDGGGWDHVSVSLKTRTPTWDEMCAIKDLFFDPHEVVMQIHPAKYNYVNHHPFCLHLWRPQSQDEIERIKGEWGSEWPYGALESPGEIPLPNLVMV